MSVVSICHLPVEILHKIFSELAPGCVGGCRRVCRQWKDAADSLSDTYWKHCCENSFFYSDYNDAKLKASSTMTWREIYIQFYSWKKMKTATMNTREGKHENVAKFNIVHNIVGCALSTKSSKKQNLGNTIVYVNLDTMQECDRIKFDLLFQTETYEENENLIIFLRDDFKLCVIPKATKKPYVVGEVEHFFSYRGYSMIGEEVYFKNSKDSILYVATIETMKSGEIVIKKSPLEAFDENHDSFEEYVVAFAKIPGTTKHDVNILTDEGNMYDHKDNDFGYFNQYDRWSAKEILYDLKCNGFDWTSHHVYNWLAVTYYMYTIQMKNVKHKCLFSRGPQIIFGDNKSRKVYICDYPRSAQEYIAKPFREIDVEKLFTIKSPKKEINQVSAVEIQNGCTVVILTAGKLFAVEFDYKSIPVQVKGGKKKVPKTQVSKNPKKVDPSAEPTDDNSEKKVGSQKAKSRPSNKVVLFQEDEASSSGSYTRSGKKRVSSTQESVNNSETKKVKGKREAPKINKGTKTKKPTHKYMTRLKSSMK